MTRPKILGVLQLCSTMERAATETCCVFNQTSIDSTCVKVAHNFITICSSVNSIDLLFWLL